MPTATVKSPQFGLEFQSPADFLAFINTQVVPTAMQYGYRLTVEPRAKGEVDAIRL